MVDLGEMILKALLSKGYFPKELPPVFTTTDFGTHADVILDEWQQGNVFGVKRSKDFGKIGGKRFRSGRYSYFEHIWWPVKTKPKIAGLADIRKRHQGKPGLVQPGL